MRNLNQLIETNDPAWPEVQSWIAEAKNPVEVLTPYEECRNDALLEIQVTTRTPMGAIIYETGGIIVENGLLRILGSSCPELTRSLPDWNHKCGTMGGEERSPFLLVSDDVIGGFYAINGGALGEDAGNVYYFAPDSLDWEPMEMSYTEFLLWAFSGEVQGFYEEFLWKEWQAEIEKLTYDQVISFYPFPWTAEFNLESSQRGAVPVLEAFEMQMEFAQKMNG